MRRAEDRNKKDNSIQRREKKEENTIQRTETKEDNTVQRNTIQIANEHTTSQDNERQNIDFD